MKSLSKTGTEGNIEMWVKITSKYNRNFAKIYGKFYQIGDVLSLPPNAWKMMIMLHTHCKESVRSLLQSTIQVSKDNVALKKADGLVNGSDNNL